MLQVTESTQQKHCGYCGRSLDPLKGRADRRYCDERCRYNKHNRDKQQRDPEVARINKILQDNLVILTRCHADKQVPVYDRQTLLRLGFSFDYYTMVKGDYFFCYYYGYTNARKENHILIVKGFDDIVRKP
ncbi:MAG: hypothetical protein JO301_00035 [Chitinophagaceae bacterium]|nr:hypothetical protein [Chitinophagaceae bacterium]